MTDKTETLYIPFDNHTGMLTPIAHGGGWALYATLNLYEPLDDGFAEMRVHERMLILLAGVSGSTVTIRRVCHEHAGDTKPLDFPADAVKAAVHGSYYRAQIAPWLRSAPPSLAAIRRARADELAALAARYGREQSRAEQRKPRHLEVRDRASIDACVRATSLQPRLAVPTAGDAFALLQLTRPTRRGL